MKCGLTVRRTKSECAPVAKSNRASRFAKLGEGFANAKRCRTAESRRSEVGGAGVRAKS